MSHAGKEINIKRVRFCTSPDPTNTTQLVVGPDLGTGRGLYLDGVLIGPSPGGIGTLQAVTALGEHNNYKFRISELP